jgi:hypothetical protein
MFVMIENYWADKPLILNVDCISEIMVSPQSFVTNEDRTKIVKINNANYYVVMNNGVEHGLTEEQYIELCKILITRL